jgi:hypothetical protein
VNLPARAEGGKGLVVHGIGIACFGVFVGCFFALIRWTYPEIGHDYRFFFAELLEGIWQFHHFGIGIPRYAVHLCGGSVLYGNPQDMFYSPTQFFALLLDPWRAIQLTILIFLIVGYVGWYRVGRDLLGISKQWSHVLALVVQANGFYFIHLVAGHVTYHAFALLGWFFLLLFDRKEFSDRASAAKRAAAFALLCAYVLYSGSWFVLFFLAIGFLLVLPLEIFLVDHPWKRFKQIMLRTTLFGAAALAIMGSKLVAIYSFMRFYPRVTPLITQDPSRSTVGFIADALWGLPQNGQRLGDLPGWPHEKSMLLSPITLIGLALGLMHLRLSISRKTGMKKVSHVAFVLGYGGLLLAMMIHLVRGYGWIADAVHRLPVGSSQYVSSRYLYLFALLLSVAGIWSMSKMMGYLGSRWNTIGMLFAAVTTIAAFAFGYVGMLPEVGMWTNVKDHRELWRRFDVSSPVAQVVSDTDFLSGTGRSCYEPILNSANNPSSVLHVGPVSDVENGYFNLMNPSCYQYPSENHCKPGDRIAVDDAENFAHFTHGLPVTWKVSRAQRVADVASGISLLCLLALFRYSSLLLGRGFRRSRSQPVTESTRSPQ